MILWIFPLISCAGVLFAGFAWVHAGPHGSARKLALIPVTDAEVTQPARLRFGLSCPQGDW
jgi:hypothetical protein